MAEAPTPKQIANTIYDKMEFPQYEFREFPVAIPLVDGVPCFDPEVLKAPYDRRLKPPQPYPVVRVYSQAELDELKGGSAKLVPENPDAVSSPKRVETEDDVRAQLYVEAEQAGATIDRRWSVAKIQRAIAEARDPVV